MMIRRQGVTRADTAYVAVVATRGTAPTFSLADANAATPKSPGSYVGVSTSIAYTVDGTPTTLSGNSVPVSISIAPTAAAQLYNNRMFITGANTGTLTVSANVNVFGIPLTDTVRYTLTDSQTLYVSFLSGGTTYYQGSGTSGRYSISGTTLYIATGGGISFYNEVYNNGNPPPPVSVKFALVSGVGPPPAPTIELASYYASTRVIFPNPGTYTYLWTGAADTLIADPDKRGGTIVVR
jgi:hypothetical protein